MSYSSLTPVDDRSSVREHEDRFGAFNDAPPDFREITEADFSRGPFFSQVFRRIEYRQIMNLEGERCALGIQLFFFADATGVGMAHDHRAGKVRYFAFGCAHKYREVHRDEMRALGFRGMWFAHDHAYFCDKCGDKRVVDSSG